jgi:hypothetical protein
MEKLKLSETKIIIRNANEKFIQHIRQPGNH